MVLVLITPSAVVTTHRAEQHELRGQGDVDHVRKVRVGPRAHIQFSDLRLSACRYGAGKQTSRSQPWGFKSLSDTRLRTC